MIGVGSRSEVNRVIVAAENVNNEYNYTVIQSMI